MREETNYVGKDWVQLLPFLLESYKNLSSYSTECDSWNNSCLHPKHRYMMLDKTKARARHTPVEFHWLLFCEIFGVSDKKTGHTEKEGSITLSAGDQALRKA